MTVGITALGSGSRGNAFVVHSDTGNLLIDAGFSRRELLRRMAHCLIDPESITALLLTHEHDDHVKGCRIFCDMMNVPVFVSARTADYLLRHRADRLPRRNMINIFEPGTAFEVTGFHINPFSVQHDAVDPVGFLIRKGERRIGFASDLGAVNTLARQRLADCDVLVLESNHDLEMLRRSDRQYYLKTRIMGRHGHLNNTDAVDALPELLTERTAALCLVHVSSECNDYDLVRRIAEQRLLEIGRDDVKLIVVEQATPLSTVWLKDLRRSHIQPALA